jgi:hypothetical protein
MAGSVPVACDSAATWLRRALDTVITRHDGTIPIEFLDGPRLGCSLHAEGKMSSFSGTGPDNAVSQAFLARGWVNDWRFSADGPDGSDFGLRSLDVLCIAFFRWDGGDDSDSTVIPGDWYELDLKCSRWVPADTLR